MGVNTEDIPMTTKNSGTDVKFDELTPEQQEAYVPRGEYKDPAALDHGNAPEGAPTGPVAEDDDSVGSPGAITTEPGDAPKPKKRTT